MTEIRYRKGHADSTDHGPQAGEALFGSERRQSRELESNGAHTDSHKDGKTDGKDNFSSSCSCSSSCCHGCPSDHKTDRRKSLSSTSQAGPFCLTQTSQPSSPSDHQVPQEGPLFKALHALESTALCYFHELEDWQKDNPWIHSGYRRLTFSYAACFRSLLFVHNETGNTLSHLLGAVLFLGFAAYTFTQVLLPRFLDWVIFGFFLTCAVSCLLLSGLFHLFTCHSHPVSQAWNKCDYVGIMLMIVGSCYPSIYYSFHCTPALQVAYLLGISLFGLLTIPTLVMDRFNHFSYRTLRTWLFVCLGVSGVFPVTHAVYLHTWETAMVAGSLHWSLVMGGLYLFGAFLYAQQYPERRWPGKFDLWLNSHQIFHVCVLAAAIFHYVGLIHAYQWHVSHPCDLEPAWHLPAVPTV